MSVECLYGIMVRVYTPEADEVSGRVERAVTHARQILAVSEEFPALRRVMFLIPIDHDCGETYSALRTRVLEEELNGLVEVYALPGYHSCEVLNQGLLELSMGTSHALIVSGKALSYLTAPVLATIDNAFKSGAKVAVDQLRDIVLEGRIQNTFAAWDIDALLGVGGFDCKLDVEEMAPLIRLARKFGPCIAPVNIGPGALDLHPSSEAQARHTHVMAEKLGRQEAECKRLGSSFDFIRESVLK
jgi:hypothetical protein